jgi:A/G-specific adenine glycosylase
VTANAAERLIHHYVDKSRPLPWRAPPGEPPPNPYLVWLSEIMLQQTTVAAVKPRFERFVARWPTVQALAAADDAEVLSEWAGLGYYARARNLIACARKVVRRGGFPQSEAELRALPGIGAYTAAAIAAIAFGQAAAAVDTNVMRVIARLHGLEQPSVRQVQGLVAAMLPTGQPGDFTQAMMDLGATICRPRSPDCPACPWAADCVARRSGSPELYPASKPRRLRPVRHGIAYWVEKEDRLWLVRRPSKGMLGGMAALPGPEWSDTPLTTLRPPLATLRHVFTHFALELTVLTGEVPDCDGWWQRVDTLGEAGLPTLYRRAAELVLRSRSEGRAAAA